MAFYYFFIRPYAYRWKPCYGLKAYGICVPCCYDVHGIDISHYQGDIDWGQLTQSRLTDFPIEFVLWRLLREEIMAMILLPVTFPKRESTDLFVVPIIFLSGYWPFKTGGFLYSYSETCSGRSSSGTGCGSNRQEKKEELQGNIKRWLDRIEAHYGVKPILYTSYKFKTRYLSDSILILILIG